jgi:gas vesicle protein
MRIGKYETSESGSSTVGTAISFLLIGLGIGAAVGMLLAPKSGKQIRKDLRRSYDDTIDTISEWTDEAKERFEEVVEKGAGITEERRAKAEPLTRRLRRD